MGSEAEGEGMTEKDFRRETDAIFARRPAVPAAIGLVDGPRVVVDARAELGIRPDGFQLLRRSDPGRTPIPFDRIKWVVGLDELPAEDGGMSYRDFYATIRPLFWAEPFRPFAIELRSGRTLAIDRPSLCLAGRHCIYLPPGGRPVVRFQPDQVVRITVLDPAEVT